MIPFKLIAIAITALIVAGGTAATVLVPKSQSNGSDSTSGNSTPLSVLSSIPSGAGSLIIHSDGTAGSKADSSSDSQTTVQSGSENPAARSNSTIGGDASGVNETEKNSTSNIIGNVTQGDIGSENVTESSNITITGPAHGMMFVEATGPAGAKISFHDINATDGFGQPLSPVCTPVTGSTFPLGTTRVTCSATDRHGRAASTAFDVVVRDTTAPSLVAPDDITALATGTLTKVSLGAPVVTDAVDSSPKVSNDAPPNGFPVGDTVVTWTATDSSGNTQTAQQLVTITNESSQTNANSSEPSTTDVPQLTLSGAYYNDTSSGRIFVGPATTFALGSTTGNASTVNHYRYYRSGDSGNLPGFANGSTFTVAGHDGEYVIEYYGQNSTLVQSLDVTYDGSPPTSSASIANDSSIASADSINITAADSGSGLAKQSQSGVYYSIDGNSTFSSSKTGLLVLTASALKSGHHMLTFYSVDNVGNKETVKTISFNLSDCSTMPTELVKGVVFADPTLTTTGDGQPLTKYSMPSIDSKIADISSRGFNTISVPFFWSAYSDNPTATLSEMSKIAASAQNHKLCVIFSNYQSDTGGKFGGHGFPLSVTKNYGTERAFWTDLYANRILTDHGPETIWNIQAAMMRDVISSVDKYSSVTGYEIITRPYVYDLDQYAQLGQYQSYVASQMRSITAKVIFFDKAEPRTGYNLYVDPEHDSLTKPAVSNVVFAPHFYEGAASGSAEDMQGYVQLASGWNCPLIIGEWADNSLNSTKTSIDSFDSSNAGWIWWSYDPIDSSSLMDADYKPTQNMANLQSAMN